MIIYGDDDWEPLINEYIRDRIIEKYGSVKKLKICQYMNRGSYSSRGYKQYKPKKYYTLTDFFFIVNVLVGVKYESFEFSFNEFLLQYYQQRRIEIIDNIFE